MAVFENEFDVSFSEGMQITSVGVEKVEQTIESTESGGTNEITVTMTDGTTATFNVRNGEQGLQGVPGKSAEDAILYTEQTLAEDCKAQARANIGAMPAIKIEKEETFYLEFEQGSIKGADGTEIGGENRIRSDYIDVTDIVKVATTDKSGYDLYGHFYDADRYLGNTGAWVDSFAMADIIKQFPGVRYFRIVARMAGDKNLVPNDSKDVFEVTYKNKMGVASDFVLYEPQELTDEQKAQARANIGVVDEAVCVSYEQPSDPKAQIWYNPNGDTGIVQEKEEVNAPSVVAGIVGLALSEMLNNTAALYATIEDALAGASATADGKVLAYSCGGKFNIMLLDDIASAATINITKDCTLHLNGKTLSFTEEGAYLNINTASEVTINGMVADSKIVKSGVTSSKTEYLLNVDGTHLVMLGGTYSATDITAKLMLAIRINNCKIDMNGCAVIIDVPCGIRGMQIVGESTINNCQFELTGVTSEGAECTAILAGTDTTTITNSTIYALSPAKCANVIGVRAVCENIIVTNCHIEVDGYGDTLNEEGESTGAVCAISADPNTTITINGGYYLGRREALYIAGPARINGGLFEGCQHGGAYMMGTDIKAKNAIFRSVPYKGVAMGTNSPKPFGALYCGSSSAETEVYLDNCRIETVHHTWYGLVAKSNDTNVYLSNCVLDIIDSVNGELRADAKDTIYIGKNVSFDPTKVQLNKGTLDTTTYADQEFGFETETTTSNALLSVKDERGNWVGIV